MIVVGVSNCARVFHLLALVVFSQRKTCHYTEMFAALQRIYTRVFDRTLVFDRVMGDADDAQFNDLAHTFGSGAAEVNYLMCFYHVVAKVFERTRSLQPPRRRACLLSGVT